MRKLVTCQHCHGTGYRKHEWVSRDPKTGATKWQTSIRVCPICRGEGRIWMEVTGGK